VVTRIVDHRRRAPLLLQIRREIQEELDWISSDTANAVAECLSIPTTQVDSVVQSYAFLHDQPRGRYRILFSDNITDRMLRSLTLFEHMLKRLRLQRGEVSTDGAVT
jgi:[NiFe] hydrogenase diaphorase moiety large subunit